MLKIADFANFGPKYLGPQIFTRLMFDLGILYDADKRG